MKILNVTPQEYSALKEAQMNADHGELQIGEAARICGVSCSELCHEDFRVVIRYDCTFIPVYWRNVQRIENIP